MIFTLGMETNPNNLTATITMTAHIDDHDEYVRAELDTFDLCVARHEADAEAAAELQAEWQAELGAERYAAMQADGDLHLHELVDVADVCSPSGHFSGFAGDLICWATDDYSMIDRHVTEVFIESADPVACDFCGEEIEHGL